MTNADKLQDIQNEIDKIIKSDKLNLDMCQKLTYLKSAETVFKQFLNQRNEIILNKDENTFKTISTAPMTELNDIEPSLMHFIKFHTLENLQKLCLEIQEFCQSVYALTQNEEERSIYFDMARKINR